MDNWRSGSYVASDRFVPVISSDALSGSQIEMFGSQVRNDSDMEGISAKRSLIDSLARSGIDATRSVLPFNQISAPGPTAFDERLKALYSEAPDVQKAMVKLRDVPQNPIRVLDAPGLSEDFYSSCLDWGNKNSIAVALGSAIYTWDQSTGAAKKSFSVSGDRRICGVRWTEDGRRLAIGTTGTNTVELWCTETGRKLRTLVQKDGTGINTGIPNTGCCAMSWNSYVLSIGYGDGKILQHDVRVKDTIQATLTGHTDRVVGLAVNKRSGLLASGANDNTAIIWDSRHWNRSLHLLTGHTGAVKAIGWSPHDSSVLVTGGGSQDRNIKSWNTLTGLCTRTLNTGSQVLSLQWSPHSPEFVTTHGFNANNVCLWSFPDFSRLAELKGHTNRVLHSSLSPDGLSLATAGDDTIRFWSVFRKPKLVVDGAQTSRHNVFDFDRL